MKYSFLYIVNENISAYCAGLSENGPYMLICWKAWFPVSRTIWKGFGGRVLLGDVYYWGRL